MKVLMVGTTHCTRCKMIAPKVEEYCKEHNIEYEYINLENAPSSIYELLVEKKVKSAPAFIIQRNLSKIVVSGDDIFVELENISK